MTYAPVPYPTELLGYIGLYVKLSEPYRFVLVTWIADGKIGYGYPLRFSPLASVEGCYVRL